MADSITLLTARRQYMQLAARMHSWSQLCFAIVPSGEQLDNFFSATHAVEILLRQCLWILHVLD
jgi:hypothetical protein